VRLWLIKIFIYLSLFALLVVQMIPGVYEAPVKTETGGAGEYKLTYLHNKAGTFSLVKGLMD
jgi:hypothetical protein